MKKNRWYYIDEYQNNLPESLWIQCDTHDFNVLYSDSRIRMYRTHKIINKMIKDNKVDYFTVEEINQYLKDLENKTGGKGSMRFMCFGGDPTYYRFITFHKVDGNPSKYVGFFKKNGYMLPINKNKHSSDKVNVSESVLNFQK